MKCLKILGFRVLEFRVLGCFAGIMAVIKGGVEVRIGNRRTIGGDAKE